MQNFVVVSFRPIHYRGRLLRARTLGQFFLFFSFFLQPRASHRVRSDHRESVRGIKYNCQRRVVTRSASGIA